MSSFNLTYRKSRFMQSLFIFGDNFHKSGTSRYLLHAIPSLDRRLVPTRLYRTDGWPGILCSKNNPLYVGEPGVGKTELAKILAKIYHKMGKPRLLIKRLKQTLLSTPTSHELKNTIAYCMADAKINLNEAEVY